MSTEAAQAVIAVAVEVIEAVKLSSDSDDHHHWRSVIAGAESSSSSISLTLSAQQTTDVNSPHPTRSPTSLSTPARPDFTSEFSDSSISMTSSVASTPPRTPNVTSPMSHQSDYLSSPGTPSLHSSHKSPTPPRTPVVGSSGTGESLTASAIGAATAIHVTSLPVSMNPTGVKKQLKHSTSYYVVDENAKGNQQLDTDIENLIFRGGGMKGIAYCGALEVIANLGMLDHVKRFAGTSAGSMCATFLACGYTAGEIERMFRTTNFKAFKDSKKGIIAKVENLYKRFGMYEGKVFYEWMGRRIAEKTENPDITFEELYQRTQKELVVVGTCLSHCEVHYFSHHTAPQMKVRDAVRISMSIPLFFEPVKIDDHFFVDGCVLDNFPLWVFDSEEFNPEAARVGPVNMKTIGFYIVEDSEVDQEVIAITGLKEYVGCMLTAFMNRISQLAFKQGDEGRMLQIKARHVQAANFGLGDAEKDLLYHEGQLAARRFYGVTEAHLGEDFVKVNQLIVKLKNGHGLKGLSGITHGDVYVNLTVGTVTHKSSVKRSSRPVWDDVYVFKAQSDHVLKVEVCYHKSMRSTKCIASHEIKLTELENDTKKEIVVETEDKGHVTLQVLVSPAI